MTKHDKPTSEQLEALQGINEVDHRQGAGYVNRRVLGKCLDHGWVLSDGKGGLRLTVEGKRLLRPAR